MKLLHISIASAAVAAAAAFSFSAYSSHLQRVAYENRPIITEDCVMNGLGQGNCTFTNTGRTTGAVCGVIQVMGPGIISSSKFCSGQVDPQTTEKVEFHIPQVDQLCDNGFESWMEKCDFTFLRDDAPKTKDGEVEA